MYQPITIPLTSGVRKDVAQFAQVEASWLKRAENVVFTKAGGVRGRPSYRSRDGSVQVGNAGTAVASGLGTAFSGLQQAGIVSTKRPGTFGAESPMVLYQGGQAIRTQSLWLKVGEHTFFRQSKSPTLRPIISTFNARQNPVPCGTNVVGVRNVPQGFFSGIPLLNSRNEISQLIAVAQTNWDSTSDANCAAAGDVVFYARSTGDVRAASPGGDVSIGTGSATTGTPAQIVSAVLDATGNTAFVAYVSATAGRITLKKVTLATGAVVATLDVNGLGTVSGCALAYLSSGGDRLVLAWVDTVAGSVKSKVFTSSGTTITDAALNLTHPDSPNTTEVALAAGTAHSNQCIITYTGFAGDLQWVNRSFTAATSSDETPLYGSDTNRLRWNPLFGAVALNGRTYIGVQRRDGDKAVLGVADIECQWMVLDVTRLAEASALPPWSTKVVAMGRSFGAATVAPSSVGRPDSNSIAFGVVEGVQFSTVNATQGAIRRVVLTHRPAQAVDVHGTTHASGAVPGVFDGRVMDSHPFPETYPRITQLTETAASGTLPAGSYSYQATWEVVNSAGQVVRSGASDIMTDSSVALNAKVTATITVPQFVEYSSTKTEMRVVLWGTEVNPSAGATLYEVGQVTFQAYPTAATVAIEHTAPVSTSSRRLYTVGGVVDDEPAPTADRGVTEALGRVWVAEQNKVHVSKLLDSRFMVAWNTEGLHTLNVPTHLGEVQGLAGTPDYLLVVCSGGAAVVRGAGYDDLGNGPGWELTALNGVPVGAYEHSPRSVLNTPVGCVYGGADGGVWALTVSGAERLSGPHREVNAGPPYDLAYVASKLEEDAAFSQETTPTLFVGSPARTRVLDVEWSQWGEWSTSGLSSGYLAGVAGTLWTQSTGFPTDSVQSFDDLRGVAENSVVPVSYITTSWHRLGGQDSSYGRVRSVTPVGTEWSEGASTFTLRAYGDNNSSNELGSAVGISWAVPVGTDWPAVTWPEVVMSRQRTSSVQVYFEGFPLHAELTGFEVLQWSAPGRAPRSVKV